MTVGWVAYTHSLCTFNCVMLVMGEQYIKFVFIEIGMNAMSLLQKLQHQCVNEKHLVDTNPEIL